MKFKGYLFGCISSGTYGLIPLFALPMIHKGMAIDSILCYRFACASLVLCLMLLARKESLRITGKEWLPLIFLGLLFSSSAQFLFLGYDYLSVGVASTILFIYPAFVALIMFFVFKEKISWVTQISILLAFSGVALLYQGDDTGPLSLPGVGIILLSALSYAVYMVVVNKSGVKEMNGTKLTFYAMMFSALFFLVKVMATGGLQPFPDSTAMLDLLLLAIIPTAVSGITMVYAVHYIGSTATAVLGAMEPVTALLVGIFAFSEPFTLNLAIGIFLIVGAVTLIVLADHILAGLKEIMRSLGQIIKTN